MSWPTEELEDLFIFEDGKFLEWWSAFVKALNEREDVMSIDRTKFYCADGVERDNATIDDFEDMFAPDSEKKFTENVDRLVAGIRALCTNPFYFNSYPTNEIYMAKSNPDYDPAARYAGRNNPYPNSLGTAPVGSLLPYLPATFPNYAAGQPDRIIKLQFWEDVRDFFDEAKYVGLALRPESSFHRWTEGQWVGKFTVVNNVSYNGGWRECVSNALIPYSMDNDLRVLYPTVWAGRSRCTKVAETFWPYAIPSWGASYYCDGPEWTSYLSHWYYPPNGGAPQYHPGAWTLWGHSHASPPPPSYGGASAAITQDAKAQFNTIPLENCGSYIGAWCYAMIQGGPEQSPGNPELVTGVVGGDVTTLVHSDVESNTPKRGFERMNITGAVSIGNAFNYVSVSVDTPGGHPWVRDGVYDVENVGTYPSVHQEVREGIHPTGGSASVTCRDIFVFCDARGLIEN